MEDEEAPTEVELTTVIQPTTEILAPVPASCSGGDNESKGNLVDDIHEAISEGRAGGLSMSPSHTACHLGVRPNTHKGGRSRPHSPRPVSFGAWARTTHSESANLLSECCRCGMKERAELERCLRFSSSTAFANPFSRHQISHLTRPSVFSAAHADTLLPTTRPPSPPRHPSARARSWPGQRPALRSANATFNLTLLASDPCGRPDSPYVIGHHLMPPSRHPPPPGVSQQFHFHSAAQPMEFRAGGSIPVIRASPQRIIKGKSPFRPPPKQLRHPVRLALPASR